MRDVMAARVASEVAGAKKEMETGD